MTISKFFIIGILSIGLTYSYTHKIAIGGFKSSGISKTEIENLKQEIDNLIQAENGFTLTNFKAIDKKLNQDTPNLLDCLNLSCAHEIAHIFGLNAVISIEIKFHQNGVNIMTNIFSHSNENFIAKINEEHAPIRFSAVKGLITDNYIPELLEKYSKVVKPNFQIIEPAKFYSIPETNNLNIILNLTDNRGLKNYSIKYSKNGGQSFDSVENGNFNGELSLEAFSISIPLESGITDKGMVQIKIADIDGNTRIRNSELFTVKDNTPPYIIINNPKKSEIIKGSNKYNITWEGKDNLGIKSYKILYSTNNGNSYQPIVELNGSFSNFLWNVPDLLTNSCFVKIIATDYTRLKSEYKIGPISVMDGAKPAFTIITDVSEKSYPENTNLEMVLNLRDNTGVKVVEAYFTKNKSNYELLSQTIFDDLIKNENKIFNLKLPYGVTSDAQIKWVVKDLFENETSIYTEKYNITDNTPPTNEIVYPVKGIKFKGLEQGKIIWSSTDNTTIASHEVYYSLNNGKSWYFISKSGGDKNNIIWNIPDVNTATAKLKLVTKDIVGLSSEKISEIFEIKDIINPTIELIEPTNFSQFRERDSIRIHINLKDNIGLKNSQVYLKIGAQSHNLDNKTYIKGTKTQQILLTHFLSAMPQDNISIIIISTDEAGNQITFTSESFNLIDNTPPTVDFDTNLTGETIDGKSKFKLNWSARDNVGIKQIKLDLTANGGISWQNIHTFNSKIEEYLWNVPNLHSSKCQIRISVTDVNDFISEEISSIFSINDKSGPELIVLSPKVNKSYKEYEIINASVLSNDDYGLGLIELYYSSDGLNFDYISNEAFTPDITKDTVSFTVKIKKGISYKSVFKFIGLDRFNNESEVLSPIFRVIDNTPPTVDFTLNLPGAEFGTGKAYNIDWTGQDNLKLKNTQLEYSCDNGNNWTELYNNTLDNKETKQTFTWLIPLELRSPCQLRVTMVDNMNLKSISTYSDFIIIDLTNPEIKINSSPVKTVNETENYNIDLELTDNYDINSIDFYYSSNLNDYNYLSSISDLKGKKYNINQKLTIPKGISKSAIIKMVLKDSSSNTTTKFTEKFKTIDFTNPSISLNSKTPDVLLNNEEFILSWTSSDNESINSHLIEFSNDTGNNWKKLSRLPASQNEWSWKVPNIVSNNNSKLRIITIDHVNLTDTISTNLFSIKDKTNPKLNILVKKGYTIEVKEKDTLYQKFEISDNVQIKSLKIEYSNINRQFKSVANIDFEIENTSYKILEVGIPIPEKATKNAKIKATLMDVSGNSVQKTHEGIRVLDNTNPIVKFLEPRIENLKNIPILIVGDTLRFQWQSIDNSGIRSNKISFKLMEKEYWQPILTTKGEETSLAWTIPEKAIGKCEFQIITTDKVGLKSTHTIGPYEIKDILEENERQNHLLKYGTISIESNPSGAMVILDNIEKGYTPLELENISEGNHRLVLFKRKFKQVSKIVKIYSDSLLSINELLEKNNE